MTVPIERFGELVPQSDLARFGQLANSDAVIEQAEINAPHRILRVLAGRRYGRSWPDRIRLEVHRIPDGPIMSLPSAMFHHDPAAMLYAPLRVVIHADQAGDTPFRHRPASTSSPHWEPGHRRSWH